MKRVPLVLVGFMVCFALLTAFLWIRWHISPLGKYNTFLKQELAYYRQVGTACDVLIARLPAGQTFIPIISGDDASLPEVLRNLEADSFYVATNQVLIRFGVGEYRAALFGRRPPFRPPGN
jgi:hypothetical protein